MTAYQHPVTGQSLTNSAPGLTRAREQISSAQFTDLAIMIDEVITEELGSPAAPVEEAAKK